MEQVWIRPFRKETDTKLHAEWLFAGREKNRFDPDVFRKEQATIYVAYDSTGVIGFIPVVNGNIVESLAFKPGISPITEARALQAWQHVIIYKMHEQNIPNLYFVTFDETVLKFARHHGWRDVIVPMVTLRAMDLEKGDS